jgi:hypothetical protein
MPLNLRDHENIAEITRRKFRTSNVISYGYLCMYLSNYSAFEGNQNVYARTIFTKDARSFSLSLKHLKQPEPHRSLCGSGVLHIVQLFSPLSL